MTTKPLAQTLLAAFLLACGSLFADDLDMKIDRAVIFSSGVAYFDYRADVTGDAVGRLNLRTEQINDVLKSLVVADHGGGVISVVNYASQDPLERTLKSFRVDLTDRPSLSQILDRLRGEPVEVTGVRAATGLIVGVDVRRVLPDEKQLLIEEQYLNVLTTTGMVQVPLAGVENLKFTNDQVNQELQNALATLAAGASKDKKSVELHFKGQGRRAVQVGYLIEAPIWKTSYRLVAGDDDKLLLQGWANVDNATEEDWKDVKLSLISGRPISFRMDLYTPLYVPRPMEQLELHASLRAPEFEVALGTELKALGYVADEKADKAARGRAGRGEIQGRVVAGAAAAEAVGGVISGAENWTYDRSAFGLSADLAMTAAALAVGEEAGELFEYRIDTPVTIPRKQSAMLPIVNAKIEAEKLSIFNAERHASHPFHGYHLTNSSKLFLMQGPVTVFEDNVYAGDAKLPDLKPDEKRLIAYALDLGMEVHVKQQPHPEEIISFRLAKGTLVLKRRFVDDREYVVKNKDQQDRTLLIEQTYGDEWTLVKPKEPFERTATTSRFRLAVPGGKSVSESVTLEQTADQMVALTDLGTDQIEIFIKARTISPQVKSALETLVAKRAEIDGVIRQRQLAENQYNTFTAEQVRIRENLKTLDKGSDVYKRQLTKFDELETSIEKFREQVATLKSQESSKQQELTHWLLSLTLE